MRYNIILVSFVFGTTQLIVSDCIGSKIELVSNNPLQLLQKGEDHELVGNRHVNKTINRQKRSIWTMLINHISSVAETFHMKPLLAEGVNDVDIFGKKIENKYYNNPKFTNAMLSKGVGDGENIGEKKEEIKKTKNPEKEDGVSEKAKVTLDKETLIKVKSNIKTLIELNKVAVDLEEKLLEVIKLKGKGKIDTVDLMYLRYYGLDTIEKQNTYKKHIAGNPELESFVKSAVLSIRDVRQNMIQIEKELPKSPLSGLTKDEADEMGPMLLKIQHLNEYWFKGKVPRDVLKESGEKYDIPKEKIEEIMKKMDKDKDPEIMMPEEPDDKLMRAKSKVLYLSKLHEIAEELEEDLFDYLLEHKGETKTDDIMDLYFKGANHLQTETIYQKLIKNNSEVEKFVKGEVETIRDMREELKKVEEEEIPKLPLSGLTKDEQDDVELKLAYVKDSNKNWFLGKNRPSNKIHNETSNLQGNAIIYEKTGVGKNLRRIITYKNRPVHSKESTFSRPSHHPTLEEGIESLKNDTDYLVGLQKTADELEEKFFDDLLAIRGEFKHDDIMNLYFMGTKDIKREKLYRLIVKKHPEKKYVFEDDLGAIKSLRLEIEDVVGEIPELTKSTLPGLTKDEQDDIELKLAYIKDSNNNWLLGKNRPSCKIHNDTLNLKGKAILYERTGVNNTLQKVLPSYETSKKTKEENDSASF